jgi:hypothetical protein
MKSRSGFTAVHAPPSHLVTSLYESLTLALEAASDAVGPATIAANAMAVATVIFETMSVLQKKGSLRADEMGTLLLTPGRERCGTAHEQLVNESARRTCRRFLGCVSPEKPFLADFRALNSHL